MTFRVVILLVPLEYDQGHRVLDHGTGQSPFDVE